MGKTGGTGQADPTQDGCPDGSSTRTDWAENRTLQANERMFAGWMRTGLGAIGVAVAGVLWSL